MSEIPRSARLIPRVALLAALIYVFSWATSFLPNVKPTFFLTFSAGFMWGLWPGMAVGGLGTALWTLFNPLGPAPLPIMAVQVIACALSGVIGAVYAFRLPSNDLATILLLIVASFLCTIAFYLPVSAVDAWLYQPFWPRFYMGMLWSLWSLGSNAIIFPLFFKALYPFYKREKTLFR